MTSDFKASRARRSNAHQAGWPGARNSGPSWASPAVTNGRIAIVAGTAVIDGAGSVVVAAAVIDVRGNRSRGRRSNGGGRRTHNAHATRFGRRRNGSRERRGGDKHQGNLFHW